MQRWKARRSNRPIERPSAESAARLIVPRQLSTSQPKRWDRRTPGISTKREIAAAMPSVTTVVIRIVAELMRRAHPR
jgi:hypothetical protein